MGICYNPKIVREGLVLHLDAANVKSYPGSGTTWYDLTRNNFDSSINNGAIFDVDVFTFDGANDYILTPTSIGLELTNNLTFCVAAKRNGDSASSINGLIGNLWHSTYTGISMYLKNDSTNVTIQTANGTERTSYILYNVVNNMEWNIYQLTVSNGIVSLYINDNLVDSRERDLVQDSTKPVVLAKWAESYGSYYLNGSISFSMVYNRSLTSTEIKQNFNAMRGRFGV